MKIILFISTFICSLPFEKTKYLALLEFSLIFSEEISKHLNKASSFTGFNK